MKTKWPGQLAVQMKGAGMRNKVHSNRYVAESRTRLLWTGFLHEQNHHRLLPQDVTIEEILRLGVCDSSCAQK